MASPLRLSKKSWIIINQRLWFMKNSRWAGHITQECPQKDGRGHQGSNPEPLIRERRSLIPSVGDCVRIATSWGQVVVGIYHPCRVDSCYLKITPSSAEQHFAILLGGLHKTIRLRCNPQCPANRVVLKPKKLELNPAPTDSDTSACLKHIRNSLCLGIFLDSAISRLFP